MNRKLGRELALISLPLVIIGGAAWLLPRGGLHKSVSAPDNGPARLEFAAFKPIEVSPMEVYQGVNWKVGTSVAMKGKLQVPALWKPYSIAQGLSEDCRIVYRISKQWKEAPALPGNLDPIAPGFGLGERTLSLHLETVPSNAQEVRLRGKFTEDHIFRGALPPGWKPPANYKKYGKSHDFRIESKPFDLLVKAPGQPMPRPTASRETGVRVIKSSYNEGEKLGEGMIMSVQLRRDAKFGQPKNYEGASLISLQLLDGQGRTIDVCEAAGSRTTDNISMGQMNRDGLGLPASDFTVTPRIGYGRGELPCGGWKKVRGPYQLRAVISDQYRWPIVVDVPVPSAIYQ